MADLLRKGYTMLNLACPICKNPIFRSKSGEMFCIKCNKLVIFSEERSKISSNERPEIEVFNKINESSHNVDTLSLLYDVISKKLNLITVQLKNETDVSILKNHLSLIRKFLKILLQIQYLKKS